MIGFFLFYFIFFHFHTLRRKWKMVSRIIRVPCSDSDTNTWELSGSDQRVQLWPEMPSEENVGVRGCPPCPTLKRSPPQRQDAPSSQSASGGGDASTSFVQLSDSRLNAALSDKSVRTQIFIYTWPLFTLSFLFTYFHWLFLLLSHAVRFYFNVRQYYWINAQENNMQSPCKLRYLFLLQ